ncbi:protein TORNADO 2-like protein [Corchorus capsularis]|uniref:Protein TORNADO 2-like protein n=1 Tax=Corchorus capsularis TaxID=210143 RepID=A0A1R3KHC2_COCAP|nr:protein TORNADO 2-like protein [Corchorus capsularis]
MAERNNNNNMVGITILITMLLAVPILGCGVLLTKQPDNTCCSVEILPWALIILGFSIMAVTLLGFLGNCRFIVYFVAVFIFIVYSSFGSHGCFHLFGPAAPGRSYVEHDLNDFHGWLRRKVATPYKWDPIRDYRNSTHLSGDRQTSTNPT